MGWDLEEIGAAVENLVAFEFAHAATWDLCGFELFIPCGGVLGFIREEITPQQLGDVVAELASRGFAPYYWYVYAPGFGPGGCVLFGGAVTFKLQHLLYPGWQGRLKEWGVRREGPECFVLPGPAPHCG